MVYASDLIFTICDMYILMLVWTLTHVYVICTLMHCCQHSLDVEKFCTPYTLTVVLHPQKLGFVNDICVAAKQEARKRIDSSGATKLCIVACVALKPKLSHALPDWQRWRNVKSLKGALSTVMIQSRHSHSCCVVISKLHRQYQAVVWISLAVLDLSCTHLAHHDLESVCYCCCHYQYCYYYYSCYQH